MDLLGDLQGRAEMLFSQAQVEAAIEAMAESINRDLAGRDLLLLCVMNGGLVFAGQLLLRLTLPLRLDYVHASRYGQETTGGQVEWRARPRQELRDRSVLVVDDILDQGYTLQAILDDCRKAGAAEVKTAVLVEKRHQRPRAPVPVEYRGLTVPDRFVFGYGMDWEGYGRNLPGIYALTP